MLRLQLRLGVWRRVAQLQASSACKLMGARRPDFAGGMCSLTACKIRSVRPDATMSYPGCQPLAQAQEQGSCCY